MNDHNLHLNVPDQREILIELIRRLDKEIQDKIALIVTSKFSDNEIESKSQELLAQE